MHHALDRCAYSCTRFNVHVCAVCVVHGVPHTGSHHGSCTEHCVSWLAWLAACGSSTRSLCRSALGRLWW